jgi:uncharacterized membrane protein YhaH (DUF805 family)
MKQMKLSASARALATVAVLLVALVLVGLVFSLIPAARRQHDTTANGVYSISSVTRRLLASRVEPVTVYVVCENGKMDIMPRVLLDHYAATGIDVIVLDPVKDAEKLAGYSLPAVSNYMMIVESARRYTAFDLASCQYYYVEGVGQVPISQYRQMLAYAELYQSYYGIDVTVATPYLSLESKLTGAIEYVTLPTIPHLHLSSGSGERELGETALTMLDQMATEYETIDLTSGADIPADASPLLIYAPAHDLSDAATAKVRAYLQGGGELLLITSPANTAMPDLMSLAADFGLQPLSGDVLHEGNANNFYQTVTAIVPSVNSQHDITYSVSSSGYAPIMPDAHGIVTSATKPEGVTATVLLSTSASAYTVGADGSETDVGAVALGVVATNETSGAKLVWYSSADAFTEDTAAQITPASLYYLLLTVAWEKDAYTSSLETIAPVDMTDTPVYLDVPAVIGWSVVLVLIVPLAVLIPAIVVRVRRARRS